MFTSSPLVPPPWPVFIRCHWSENKVSSGKARLDIVFNQFGYAYRTLPERYISLSHGGYIIGKKRPYPKDDKCEICRKKESKNNSLSSLG